MEMMLLLLLLEGRRRSLGCDAASIRLNMVVLGDTNAKDDEVAKLCDQTSLREARYYGYSWGVKSNRFYAESHDNGPRRYDRVLFSGPLWAEAHLIGEARRLFDGCEFCLSDHFGVLGYIHVHDCYGSKNRMHELVARSRRAACDNERFGRAEGTG